MATEALAPEEAREAVLETVRRMCRSPDGAREGEVVEAVLATLEAEEGTVREAIVDLVDEGLLYREGADALMVDGVLGGDDVRTAVLGVLVELSSEGRGGSRDEVVRRLRRLGLPEDEVQEAIDELEESGRLEEARAGQLRPALGEDQIEEVHHQVLSALHLMDQEGQGAAVLGGKEGLALIVFQEDALGAFGFAEEFFFAQGFDDFRQVVVIGRLAADVVSREKHT